MILVACTEKVRKRVLPIQATSQGQAHAASPSKQHNNKYRVRNALEDINQNMNAEPQKKKKNCVI